MIRDEFTSLPVSRQRKYQLRKHRQGRCIVCGADAVTANHCQVHRENSNARCMRDYRARIA